MTIEEQAARIKELEAELAAGRTRAKVAETERDIIADAGWLYRIGQRSDRLFALVQDHEKDLAAHRLQLAAFDRSDSHGVDPLGTLIERALADRDTLAAEVRAWRCGGPLGSLSNEKALLKAMAATDAAGALVLAGGAK